MFTCGRLVLACFHLCLACFRHGSACFCVPSELCQACFGLFFSHFNKPTFVVQCHIIILVRACLGVFSLKCNLACSGLFWLAANCVFLFLVLLLIIN